ncbi:O-antigen ligase family protein [Vreelandella piezotolerans]|uniref:O-antigen ligase family protein n=1 Tax=Vreelandella piezotolerans TaxID=2609667 RepID=UPI001C624F44|nr:O-antigen ligase family protein [Halomonas piezotolerans]
MDMKLKRCADLLLLCFLMAWPVVDTLNGYLYYQSMAWPSISAPYKTLGFVALLGVLMIYHVKQFLYALICAALMALCVFYQLVSYGQAVESITWAVRGLLTLVLLFYLMGEAKQATSFWSLKKLAGLMFLYFFVMSVNVTLGVLGVGESQYAGGIGGKGFIIAGNEMSYLMLASASIVLFRLAETRGAACLAFVFSVFLLFFLMKATKVAMLGICLVFIFALIHNGYFKVSRLPTVYLIALVGGAAVVVFGYPFLQSTGLWDRMLFLYTLHGGFWGALLSGRLSFLGEAIELIVVPFGFWDVLFGVGVDHLLAVRGSLVEIDVIDVFITFGVMGGVLFYLPWLLGAVWSVQLLKQQPRYGISFGLLIITLIGVSLTAGHVVNSGIASSATALLIGYLYRLKTRLPTFKEEA